MPMTAEQKSRPSSSELARHARTDERSDSLIALSTDLIVTQSQGEKVMAARLQEPTLSPSCHVDLYEKKIQRQYERKNNKSNVNQAP